MRLKWFSLCLGCLPGLAWADAVDVRLHPRGMVGKNPPAIEIQIVEPIAGFELNLKRGDGKPFHVKGGGPPGATRMINLVQPEGSFKYSGELTVIFPNGASSAMELNFQADYLGQLKVAFDPKDVDIGGRKLTFRLSRPAQKAHLKVTMDTGQSAIDEDIPFDGEPADTPLTVTWPEAPGHVADINVVAYDTSGFYTGFELSPFQVDIPHEEVSFDSGKWNILSSEEPKLDDSYAKIADAVRKYARSFPKKKLQLYIAGHTDTVGGAASNRELSLQRARSIGAYFRRKGVRIPILYEGFGEAALKVGTSDETPEEKNRRVEYILASTDPTTKNVPFVPRWKRL